MKKFTTIIGIDVSKRKLDIIILRKGEEQHIELPNRESEFEKLLCIFKSNKIRRTNSLVCLEHTGMYAYPICFFLSRKKWNYSLIPGLVIKKSLGIRRGKSDKADAKAIARFGYLFQEEIQNIELPDEKLIKLKTLYGYRERLINARKTIQVPANELKDFMTKSTLGDVITESEKLVKLLNGKIKRLDEQMKVLIDSDPNLARYFELSISVPGVGPQTAIYFIITTRAYTSFSSWKKLACYSGIAPFEYKSGSSIRGRTRVSQIANKKAKSLLGMAAINSIRCDRQLKNYYERKIEEGKNPMSVVNAVRNKILARLFATVKRGTPFVPVANYLN